jgi:hypothetical protein
MTLCSDCQIPEHVCCCNLTSSEQYPQPSSGADKAYIGHVNFINHKPNHANCATSGNEVYSYVLKCKNTPTTIESGESGAVLPITALLCLMFLFCALFAFWKIKKSYIPRIKELEAQRNSLLTRTNVRAVEEP